MEVDEHWAAAEHESLAILEWPAVCKQVRFPNDCNLISSLQGRGLARQRTFTGATRVELAVRVNTLQMEAAPALGLVIRRPHAPS